MFKKKSDAGPVEERAGARQNGLTFFLLQRSRSDCVDTQAQTDLELCWSYVCLAYISRKSFATVKTLRLCQTVQMHMHAHADLELFWSDVSWASLYISF